VPRARRVLSTSPPRSGLALSHRALLSTSATTSGSSSRQRDRPIQHPRAPQSPARRPHRPRGLPLSTATSSPRLRQRARRLHASHHSGTFELSFNVQLPSGPIESDGIRFAGSSRATEAHKGIVLRLAVSLDVNVPRDHQDHRDGELRRNTTNTRARPTRDIAPNSFGSRSTARQSPRGHHLRICDVVIGGVPVTLGVRAHRHTCNLAWCVGPSPSRQRIFLRPRPHDQSSCEIARGRVRHPMDRQLTLGSSSFGLVGQFAVVFPTRTRPSTSPAPRAWRRACSLHLREPRIAALSTTKALVRSDHIDVIVTRHRPHQILFGKLSTDAHFNIAHPAPPPTPRRRCSPDPHHAGQYDWERAATCTSHRDRASITGIAAVPDEGLHVDISRHASSETVKVRSGGRSRSSTTSPDHTPTAGRATDHILIKPGRLRPGRPRRGGATTRSLVSGSSTHLTGATATTSSTSPGKVTGNRLDAAPATDSFRRDQRHTSPADDAELRTGPGLDLRGTDRHVYGDGQDDGRQLVVRDSTTSTAAAASTPCTARWRTT